MTWLLGVLLMTGMLWCQLPLHAQQGNNLPFVNLTNKNGLSSNLVQCLFQDAQGFVWIGTANGLNRFDGINFKIFTQQDAQGQSLADNSINSICQDANGSLWIGTRRGLSYLNALNGQCKNYLLGSNCYAYVDKQHTLWVSNEHRISRFDPAKSNFIHYPIDLGQQLGLTRNFVIRQPFEDAQGRFWIPTSYGVKLLDRSTGRLQSFHFPEKDKALGDNAITGIREDAAGHLYAITWGAGLLRFNESSKQFERIVLQNTAALPVNIIHDLLFDGNKVWLATEAGLVRLNNSSLRPGVPLVDYQLQVYASNDAKSLPASPLWCLLKDRAGSIWVGGLGIGRHDPALQQFATIRNLVDGNKVLGPTAFAADRFGNDSNYSFGSYDYYGITQSSGKLQRYTIAKHIFNPNFGAAVWDIALGKKGYWLATTNGLVQLGPDKRFVKKYPGAVNGSGNILPGERLWKVMEDSRGWVWVSTVRHGIGLLQPATGTITHFFSQPAEANTLFNKYASAFMEDGQGNIWMGCDKELYCWQAASQQFRVYPLKPGWNEDPRPFMQDKDGWIWLASTAGLFRFNPSTAALLPVVVDNPELNSSDVIAVDQQGKIWIGTNNGLFRYDTTTRQLKKFTTQNGLERNDNINSIYTMPNGDILLGGDGYITQFNPQNLQRNGFVPPVVITKLQVNGRDTVWNNGPTFQLPYHSSIGFEFAALNFCNAEKNQYQYMLEGIDKQWVAANGQRTVLYGELPPGRYVFMVKGSNDDGVWNENPVRFAFFIPTPWYRSAWFIVPALLLLAVLLYAAYRYRLRQALAMERLRTRIATDLHDDIGATLSSISMYSEAVKNQLKGQNPQLENVLHKMGESSREMVTSMSDIVWAISPGNDDGDKLIKRMESYAADLCAVRGIALHFSADEKIAALPLPLEHRKNIYLIFKESVNNAVKYAGANNIWVQLSMVGKKIMLLVKDDGKGYNPQQVRPGNGLKNLPLRAAEIGGQLTVIAEAGKGVEVRLVV